MRPVFIKKFADIRIHDVPEVGGKNASLAEMMANLSAKGIHVPDGFATTATAFKYFLQANKLEPVLYDLMRQGIDSISFNPDALITGIENIRKAEGVINHQCPVLT